MQAVDDWQRINVDNYLEHLQLRGIPIGIPELQRLRSVLASAPSLSHMELRDLLCSLLAKNDDQRRIIRRSFEFFLPIDNHPSQESNHVEPEPQQKAPATPKNITLVGDKNRMPKPYNRHYL